MLAPIIDEHVYYCNDTLLVYSLETGSTVTVFSGNDKLGEAIAKGGALIINLNRRLEKDKDKDLTAEAKKGAKVSNSSEVVPIQDLPASIPPPLIETTLYAGSTCIRAWGIIPGSQVRVWSGIENLGERVSYRDFVLIGLRRPLTTNDSVQVDATICGHDSLKNPSNPITPIFPQGSGPYLEKLPPPHVVRALPCQRAINLKGLLPGAQFKVFDKAKEEEMPGSVVYNLCVPEISPSVVSGKLLEENHEIRAQQYFNSLNLKSDYSKLYLVENFPREKINKPLLNEPIFGGTRRISVFHLLESAKIEFAIDDKLQGIADYDRKNEFDLGVELKPKQILKVRQGLCNKWGNWHEVEVKGYVQNVLPPHLESPHYACANLVRIAKKEEGSRVTVYVNGSFAGSSTTQLVPVSPHLRSRQPDTAQQRLTAKQTLGAVTSQPSAEQGVKVWADDLPPKPVLRFSHNPRIVEVSKLIPGARVNIFWNKLLLASKEATDTVEEIPLEIDPWPGETIHANQSLCMKKSADSDPVNVRGKMVIETVSGGTGDKDYLYLVHDRLTAFVRTQLPAKQNTKVKLISSAPDILKVVGTSEKIIPTGEITITFPLEVVSPGVAYLKLEANNFEQVNDLRWEPQKDNRYEVICQGVITCEAKTKTVKADDDFELKLWIDPIPKDRKILTESWYRGVKSVSENRMHILELGQASITERFKAPKSEHSYNYDLHAKRTFPLTGNIPDGAPNHLLKSRSGIEYSAYKEGKCTIGVKGIKSFHLFLTKEESGCLSYGQGVARWSIKPGKLVAITNLGNYTLKIEQFSVHPTLEIIVPPSPTSTPTKEVQIPNILNGWKATIKDRLQCGDKRAPNGLGCIIYYTE